MHTPLIFDVIVIGTGPAGSMAAYTAASQGLEVLLVERRKKPGTPVQCAEYVPAVVSKYVHLIPGAVVQGIDCLTTYILGEKAAELKAPGYILDRTVFDAGLARQAQAAGAQLWTETRAVSHCDDLVVLRQRNGKQFEVKGRIIIGADGPKSTVGKWMESENSKYMVGLQWRMPLVHRQRSTDVFLSPAYRQGYAWFFPKGREANIGVGVAFKYRKELPVLQYDFVREMVKTGIIGDSLPSHCTGGLIPVGGPVKYTCRNNMLLCGDAAGHTHAVTGGGIMNALAAGSMAGDVAAAAVRAKDVSLLQEYDVKWKNFMGSFLGNAVLKRQDIDENWNDDASEFIGLMKRSWIGFL